MAEAPAGPAVECLPAATVAAIERLRLRFLDGLPARRAEIESAASAPALQAALHRLAGAAGSYGCGALGAAALQAERMSLAGDGIGLVAALDALWRQFEAACGRPV